MAESEPFSKFGRHTSALEVVEGVNLSGKLAIVTGANTGIGYETTKALVSAGCSVVLACRDLTKAKEAIEQIKATYADAQCDALHLDHGSLASVKRFADEFLAKYEARELNIVVLNAAIYPKNFEVTVDGFESTLQVNLMSQQYLAELLIPKLLKTHHARLVILSSISALLMADPLNFKDPAFTEEFIAENLSKDSVFFDPDVFNDSFYKAGVVREDVKYVEIEVYGYSKAMVALLTQELHRRYSEKGLCVFSVNPGNIATSITKHTPEVHEYHKSVQNKNVEQGASTSIVCAALPGVEKYAGQFFDDCQPRTCMPGLFDAQSDFNKQLCKKMWDTTEKHLADAASKFQ